ncbi:MAG: hypothetical protein E7525_04075 [Ruminococcaceae bacterium]|nr:hypothetical protein [Oscillospiraceae bacterium]
MLSLNLSNKSYKLLIIALGVLTIGAKLLGIIIGFGDPNPQSPTLTSLSVAYYLFAAVLCFFGAKIKNFGRIAVSLFIVEAILITVTTLTKGKSPLFNVIIATSHSSIINLVGSFEHVTTMIPEGIYLVAVLFAAFIPIAIHFIGKAVLIKKV